MPAAYHDRRSSEGFHNGSRGSTSCAAGNTIFTELRWGNMRDDDFWVYFSATFLNAHFLPHTADTQEVNVLYDAWIEKWIGYVFFLNMQYLIMPKNIIGF